MTNNASINVPFGNNKDCRADTTMKKRRSSLLFWMKEQFIKKKKTQMYKQFKIQPNNTAPIQKQSALHHKHYKIKFANLLIQGEKDH